MLVRFALQTLRHRRSAFAGAFVALFCAAALVCGCAMIMETGLTGSVTVQRYAGAPVVVAGDPDVHSVEVKRKADGEVKTKNKAKPHPDRAWVPANLAARLRAVPGVTSVTTEVTFPAYLPGAAAPAQGHGWESAPLTPFTLRAGRAPVAPREVVADAAAGRRVGDRLRVQTPAGVAAYRVVGVTAQALDGQPTVFFSPAHARRLAGHTGRVAAIGVAPASAAPAVRQALAGTSARVTTGARRADAEFPSSAASLGRLVSMGAPMAGTALLVGVLAVVGAFGLAIQQRERELALLRAVAATPRQIRRMIAWEVALLGAVAAPIGAAAGLAVGAWFYGRLVALGAAPPNLPLVVGPYAPIAAVIATPAAGLLAARISARRVARIRPVEALGDAALPPSRLPLPRLLFGLAAVGGGVALTVLLANLTSDAASGPVTPLTALVWTLAVALLGPLIGRAAYAVLGLPLRLLRAPGALAGANLRAGARRLAPVITSLSLLVAMAGSMFFAQTTMGHAVRDQAAAGTVADYRVGPRVPAQAVARLRHTPGVRAVTEVLPTTVRVGLTNHSAQGVTPAGLTRTLDPDVATGSLRDLGAGTAAVAAGTGQAVGDRVALTLGDGTPTTVRVVATYRRGLGFGDFLLPRDLVAAHVDAPIPGAVLVSAPNAARADVAAAVRDYPGVGITGGRVAAAAQGGGSTSTGAAYAGLTLIIAFAAISLVNTLVMDMLGRGREFALLRLAGATRRQVARMLGGEALALVVLAMLLGAGIAAATVTAYAAGMTGGAPYAPLAACAAIAAAAALLTAAAVAPAAIATLRHRPVEAIGVRE